MDLLIGARQSDLSRLQAHEVGDRLLEKTPDLSIRYQFRKSLGDIHQEDPLWQMPEKGVFTKDFRQSLINGELDLVVHSWKDLPIEEDLGVELNQQSFHGNIRKNRTKDFGKDRIKNSATELIATLKRADCRDLLLFKKKCFKKVCHQKKLWLLCSSPRRAYNLVDFFKNHFPAPLDSICFRDVRGNILTRVQKLMEQEKADGLIVAKAALDRLLLAKDEEFLENKKKLLFCLNQCFWQVIPISENPAAAAQGALAIEAASGRKDLKSLFSSIHCESTWSAVCRERRILKAYGGGCHQKIGITCFHRPYGEMSFLRGETQSGKVLRKMEFFPSWNFLGKTLVPGEKTPVKPIEETGSVPGESKMDVGIKLSSGFYSKNEADESNKKLQQGKKNQSGSFEVSSVLDSINVVEGSWFQQRKIQYERASANAHFVARARALPESETFDPGCDIVWVSGLKTWKALARRGIWVHGSSESLGEKEDRRIDLLVKHTKEMKSLCWLKWTHDSAPSSHEMENLVTYQLVPDETTSNQDLRELCSHKALYWRSGSQFQWAVKQRPELLEREHFCGPGNTFSILCEVLKRQGIQREPKIIPMAWVLEKLEKEK